MGDDTGTDPSRRQVLRRGSAVLAGAAFAGCTDSQGSTDATDSPTGTHTPTRTATGTDSSTTQEPTASPTPTPSGYTAEMDPVGSLTLPDPPERVVGGWGFVEDVLFALGHADAVVGMARPGFWFQGFYELLPGVSPVDKDDIPNTVTEGYDVKEELLYELDPDLLATDPNRFISWYSLSPEKVGTLGDEVAPFFGNESKSARGDGWPNWPGDEPYAYYEIPEFVERYGRLFGEEERAAALVEFYEDAIGGISERVPPEDERPTIALLSAFANPENRGFFGVSNPIPERDDTYELKQYRDLGAVDAFAGMYADGGHYDLKTDAEGVLETDPDVIILDEAVNALAGENVYGSTEAYEQTIEVLRSDAVGDRVSAVADDRIYPGGTGYQGPIINLFQTEMLAKQLYPDEFGPWRGLGETPEDERLFDRERLAEIVTGDV